MEQMLDQKDQDIAELTASLKKLAQTKTQELERLPTLFKLQLQNKRACSMQLESDTVKLEGEFSELVSIQVKIEQ